MYFYINIDLNKFCVPNSSGTSGSSTDSSGNTLVMDFN